MGWRRGDKPDHDGVHEHTSVERRLGRQGSRRRQQSIRRRSPSRLFVRPIKRTKPCDVVFEPFCGSGSPVDRCGAHGSQVLRHRDQRAVRRRGDPSLARRQQGNMRRSTATGARSLTVGAERVPVPVRKGGSRG